MLVVPEQEYPLVCVAISQGLEPSQVARFETINLNSCSSWFTEMGARMSQPLSRSPDLASHYKIVSVVTVVFFSPGNQQVDAIHVTQLERDTVLVCLDRT